MFFNICMYCCNGIYTDAIINPTRRYDKRATGQIDQLPAIRYANLIPQIG